MAHFIPVLTLALSLIYQASGKGNISSDLSFDCATNGSMMIFVKNNGMYGSLYAAGKNTSRIVGSHDTNNSACSVVKHMYGDRFVFEITGCDTKETVSVILMHDNQTGSKDELLIGGKDVLFYQLKCNEVPIGGYTINKTVNINESSDKTYAQYTESPFELTMKIKETQSTSNKLVTIGDVLHLVISSNDGFLFAAETCIASDGSHKHNKTLISHGSSLDTYILSNFNSVTYTTASPDNSSTSQLEATLYAFHFANSHDVEIMCIINVCQKDDDTCFLTTTSPDPTPQYTKSTNPSTAGPGRRRRDAPGLPTTQTLHTTFRVVDQFGDNDGSVKTSGAFRRPVFWLPLAFLAMCVVRALM